MNYYIQGSAAKADQIRAAFEKLGYDISWPEGCANPDVINIGVDRNGVKYVVAETSEYIKDIIKTHPDYKELELPVEPKFKVGDWIVQNDNGTVSQITKTINAKDEYGEYHAYEHTNGYFAACFENEFHLWSIKDAKDGDVLATDNGWTCIFKAFDESVFSSYCFMDSQKWFCEFGSEAHTLDSSINGNIHPATKEQRDLLFAKMREAGYEWDADKKELRKIQPHYDIANFQPFDKVLIRVGNKSKWTCDFFSYYHKGFHCIGTDDWSQCIPFEGNENLLGTTDMCDDRFINW